MKGIDIKEGQKGYLIKEHQLVEGIVTLSDKDPNFFYFCQNVFNGSKPNHGRLYGYNYSYKFLISDLMKTYFIIPEKGMIKSITKVGNVISIKFDKLSLFKELMYVNLRISEYPDCCGSDIVHDFESSINNDLIDSLGETEIFIIRKILNKRTNTTCISLDSWNNLNRFLEKIGYVKVDSFKNANTGNICRLYSLVIE